MEQVFIFKWCEVFFVQKNRELILVQRDVAKLLQHEEVEILSIWRNFAIILCKIKLS